MTDHLTEARRKLYIAGPMTGLPDYNYPAFNAAEAELRAAGFDVANPASCGVIEGWEWADYMRRDLRMLLDCDGIAMLDGWEASEGATLEFDLAVALGMTTGDLDDWLGGK